MAKRYVKAYYDWIEQTAALSDAEKGRLFIGILEYARSGLLPDSSGRESLLFPVFKSVIDRDAETSTSNAENGAKGGRGNKAKKANESEKSEIKRNEANESEEKPTKDIRQKTKTEDEDKDKNILPPSGGNARAQARHAHGQYGWVKLTDEEYTRLVNDLGAEEVERCIAYVDECAQSNGNKNRWKDWNLTVRKCHRDGWGLNQRKPSRIMTAAEYGAKDRSKERAALQDLDSLLNRI